MKKERILKMSEQSGYYSPKDKRPALTLQGKWLQNLGFEVGDHVNIECTDDKIIITKIPATT